MSADLVIHNARILTMDDEHPRAEAIALNANRITAVGRNADILALVGPNTRVVDAGGATVLPGFNEAHMHIFGGSVSLGELSLFGVKGFDTLSKAVKDYAAANPTCRCLSPRRRITRSSRTPNALPATILTASSPTGRF